MLKDILIGLAGTLLGLLVARFFKADKSHRLAELAQVFARKEDVAAIAKKVDQAEAEANLAVRNADTAINLAQEVQAITEQHFDRIMSDFIQPLQSLTDAVREISSATAANTAILMERDRKNDRA